MLFALINDSLDDLTATTADERAEMLASGSDESLAEDLEQGEIGVDLPEWTEANFASLVATLWV